MGVPVSEQPKQVKPNVDKKTISLQENNMILVMVR
ncbi:hypothetical protein M918_18850 [Clostridium sp. BL8]|nr:hypothetical protein M918_18850 [Clostridium sp. BL8]